MMSVLRLPVRYRFDFARPRAPVINGDFTRYLDPDAYSLVCVGDVVSEYCYNVKTNYKIKIFIIDGKTRRRTRHTRIPPHKYNIVRLANPPGTISFQAFRKICQLLASSGEWIIYVDGEEDMLALPSILCSPIPGIVVYGIPGKGATIVRVDKRVKTDSSLRVLLLRPGTVP